LTNYLPSPHAPQQPKANLRRSRQRQNLPPHPGDDRPARQQGSPAGGHHRDHLHQAGGGGAERTRTGKPAAQGHDRRGQRTEERPNRHCPRAGREATAALCVRSRRISPGRHHCRRRPPAAVQPQHGRRHLHRADRRDRAAVREAGAEHRRGKVQLAQGSTPRSGDHPGQQF